MTGFRQLTILGLAVAAGACATGTGGENRDAGNRQARVGDTSMVCIFTRDIESWRRLDNQNIIVVGRAQQTYLVELFRPVQGLSFEFEIGFFDRDGRLCPFGGDSVIVNGNMSNPYEIVSIARVTEAELEGLYAERGIDRDSTEEGDVDVESLPPEEEGQEDESG